MSVVKNCLAGVEILSFNGLFAEGDFGGKREGEVVGGGGGSGTVKTGVLYQNKFILSGT